MLLLLILVEDRPCTSGHPGWSIGPMTKTTLSISLAVITLVGGFACRRGTTPSAKPADPPLPKDNPYSVFFKIQEVGRQQLTDGDEIIWLATHESQSGVARFKIRIALKKATGDLPVAFSRGAFLREKDSQPAGFLKLVATALEATDERKAKPKVDSLEFMAAMLGENLSRGSGPDLFAGGFTSTPAGNWIATKVFVADGEGEFFLNLNPKEGIGEILMKDPEYGDIVLAELERVL